MIASKPIGVIMSSIAALLDSPKAVRSPVLHDKAVKLLLAMLGPQLDVARRTMGSGLGRTVMRPGAPGECNARRPHQGGGPSVLLCQPGCIFAPKAPKPPTSLYQSSWGTETRSTIIK